MSEKDLPTHDASLAPPRAQQRKPRLFLTFALVGLALLVSIRLAMFSLYREFFLSNREDPELAYWRWTGSEDLCPQSSPLSPTGMVHKPLWEFLEGRFGDESFTKRAADWLGGAVRVPTESFDDLGDVGEDPTWEKMAKFHKYLETEFPLVHATLKVEKANTYGLLYTWEGSDPSLKPLLMMAHMDVVPVDPNTVDGWTYPPFSGHFDGESVWGRGASDDKAGLVGTIAAVELLLELRVYSPQRTVLLAFGFDEESGGSRGAGELSKIVRGRYGPDSIAFIIDEGGGFTARDGAVFASPGIAEKGNMNTRVEVTAAGGHSSVPPVHTSIGILSAILVHFENHPYPVHISRDSPTYAALQCFAQYGPEMSSELKNAILDSARSDKALRTAESILFQDRVYESLMGTTQAIDLIQGGVKSNALPEQAWAIVNHRIATQSTVAETKKRDTELLIGLAHKYNLTYTAFGEVLANLGEKAKGTLTLSTPGSLDPAPVTPTTGSEAAAYKLLSGTIKAAYNSHRKLVGDDEIFVSPGMPTGNTDTRFYWDLTPHVFRYAHHNFGSGNNPLGGGVHTVNEHIEIDTVKEMIRFYTLLIINTDEARTL